MLKKALRMELETCWSVDDLLDFNELQDIYDEIEAEDRERMNKQNR